MADESNVVSILNKLPHLAGTIVCLGCKHEWEGVAPVGGTVFECPECGTFRSVMKGVIEPEVVFVCVCGCHHYTLGIDAPVCLHCGRYADAYLEGDWDG